MGMYDFWEWGPIFIPQSSNWKLFIIFLMTSGNFVSHDLLYSWEYHCVICRAPHPLCLGIFRITCILGQQAVHIKKENFFLFLHKEKDFSTLQNSKNLKNVIYH